jgi:DNA polymerase
MRLFFDIETFSAIDLTKVGSWLYARHPTTDIRCVSYCLVVNGVRGSIETWMPGELVPQAVLTFAAAADAEAIAFNNAFDRQIWEQILTPRYGWPVIPFERHRCAQAAALARALPASLDAAAAALKIKTRKTEEGVAAMKRLAGPRRQSAKERKAGKPLNFSATPKELATLGEYNRADVLMTMEIVDRVGLLSPSEHMFWELDQRINERGAHVDIGLLEASLCLEQAAQREVRGQIAELTDGLVTTPGQRDKILSWLADHNCDISNLRKATVADILLEPKLNEQARRLLELRRDGAGAAARKFATVRRWTSEEGEPRIRYAYRYHGASSGRFASVGCQLHNLRKPEVEDVRGAIEAVTTGSLAEMRRHGFERPLETLGHITRAVVTAPPGKRLFIADLSGIEARGAAHIAGAIAELEQWRTFDRSGQPEDEPYYRTGISTFAQPAAAARKAGKTGALAFQYQGGVGAYRRVTGDSETSDEVIATRRDAWRRDHPEYGQFWRLTVFQAVQAIRHPGQEFTAKVVAFQYDLKTGFLELALPSGRRLTYPCAELIEDEQYGTTSFTFLDASGSRTGRMYHERKGSGVFGGLLLENITQALCRDIFVEAMPRLEAAGYPIVMHTHDEYVCEVPNDFGTLEEFLTIVTQPPSWAPDLPIAAKGRISDRLIEVVGSTPEAAAENAIDNAVMPEDDDEGGDDDENHLNVEPVITPAAAEPEPAHVCIHCHREPPDGLERASAYDGAWLHPACEEPFIRVRMMEEGIAWQSAEFAQTSTPPPWEGPSIPSPPPARPASAPSAGNGSGDPDGFDLERLLSPATGRGNGYPHGESAGSSAGPATEEYIYKNALGRLHMRVVRTAGKSFPTWYWSGGEWTVGWPKEVVPYRLPELLSAAADVLVLICEGEKDCDTAVRFGFIATTNPGGAGKWQPELTQYFQGRQRVCVMEDNDAAGAKHTAAVLGALQDVVPTIGVVRFPELPPGGDLSDYFERSGTKAGLLVRIEEALKAGIAHPYVLHDLGSTPMKAQRWLWPEHLPIGALELTAGRVGVGKGLLLCDLVARVTTGRAWPDGSPGPEPGSVIILTAEDRAEDYQRRLAAARAALSKVFILEFVRRNGRDELFLLAEDLGKLEARLVATSAIPG